MKIVQITDIHIDHPDENPFRIDVRRNFQHVLKAARAVDAEYLVITGDLCFAEGVADIYQWVYEQLEAQDIPYDIISGNHDNTRLMAKVFQREHMISGDELYYARMLNKRLCLFLDSSKGKHSDNQLKWLKRQLKNADGPVIIFTHYPPMLAGVPFMDKKYALQDRVRLQKILQSYSSNLMIFCGHYHVEKTLLYENMIIQITPSCFFQIDPAEEDFKVDHHRIAFREINNQNGTISSNVKYLNGFKSH